jgi:hypothetical protein
MNTFVVCIGFYSIISRVIFSVHQEFTECEGKNKPKDFKRRKPIPKLFLGYTMVIWWWKK